MVEFTGISECECPKCGHIFEDEVTIDVDPEWMY